MSDRGHAARPQTSMLRNALGVVFTAQLELALGLLASILVARSLGPSEYGHYGYAVWLCGVLILLGNFAMPNASIRYIAEARGTDDAALAAALTRLFTRWQVLSSAVVLGFFVLFTLWRPPTDWTPHLGWMLLAASVGTWSRASFWMWGSVGKGYEQFAPQNRALALCGLLNIAVVGLLAWRGAPVVAFFITYAVIGVISNLLLRVMLARRGIQAGPSLPAPEVRAKVRSYLWVAAPVMLLTVASNRSVEMLLLKHFDSSESIAYFAIGGTLTKGAVDLFVSGLSAVLLPAMSRSFGTGGRAALAPIMQQSARLYWFLGMSVAGLGAVASGPIIHALYGARYSGAVPSVIFHLVVAGASVVGGSANAVHMAGNSLTERRRLLMTTLLVNVALGALLIPRFGLWGALATYGLTQIFDQWRNVLSAARLIQAPVPWELMGRQTCASLAAAAAGLALANSLPGLWGAAIGGLVFVLVHLALCLLWRTFSQKELGAIGATLVRLGLLPQARMARWSLRFGFTPTD